MKSKNPQYNPHWAAIHDYHAEQRTLLERQVKAWHKAYSAASDMKELNALKAELAFHHHTCLHCLDTLQHETEQDYADWRAKNATA